MREQIRGPIEEKETKPGVGDIIKKDNYMNIETQYFDLPKEIILLINCSYITLNKKYTATWKPNPQRRLSTSSI